MLTLARAEQPIRCVWQNGRCVSPFDLSWVITAVLMSLVRSPEVVQGQWGDDNDKRKETNRWRGPSIFTGLA